VEEIHITLKITIDLFPFEETTQITLY